VAAQPTPLSELTKQFPGGFPTPETVQQAYDDLDLNRAIQMYRIFYPTVSGATIISGSVKAGVQLKWRKSIPTDDGSHASGRETASRKIDHLKSIGIEKLYICIYADSRAFCRIGEGIGRDSAGF